MKNYLCGNRRPSAKHGIITVNRFSSFLVALMRIPRASMPLTVLLIGMLRYHVAAGLVLSVCPTGTFDKWHKPGMKCWSSNNFSWEYCSNFCRLDVVWREGPFFHIRLAITYVCGIFICRVTSPTLHWINSVLSAMRQLRCSGIKSAAHWSCSKVPSLVEPTNLPPMLFLENELPPELSSVDGEPIHINALGSSKVSDFFGHHSSHFPQHCIILSTTCYHKRL